MVIHRILHGQNIDIELTHSELIDAYYEQQQNFDMQYIKKFMAAYHFSSDIKDELLIHLADISADIRKNIVLTCDPSFDIACDEAIKSQIKKLKEEKKEKNNEKGQL